MFFFKIHLFIYLFCAGHDLETIRERALKSIVFKLEHRIIDLEQLCIGLWKNKYTYIYNLLINCCRT